MGFLTLCSATQSAEMEAWAESRQGCGHGSPGLSSFEGAALRFQGRLLFLRESHIAQAGFKQLVLLLHLPKARIPAVLRHSWP